MRRYMRAADLAAIASGSYEDVLQRTRGAIVAYERRLAESAGDAIPGPFAVVATFNLNAFVADAAGGLHEYRIRPDQSDGRPVVEWRRPCSRARTLSEAELPDERRAALRRISEAIAAGRRASPDDLLLLLR